MLSLQEKWIKKYKELGIYWVHDGNPKRPHALLTSGNHSGGFFKSRPIIENKQLLEIAATDLLWEFDKEFGVLSAVDFFAGPKTGGEKLSEALALGARVLKELDFESIALEKSGEGEEKTIFLSDADKRRIAGKCVFICDDVVTTSGSILKSQKAIEEAGGIIFPATLVLVNRSGLKYIGMSKIISLVDVTMPIYEPEECPLCSMGSVALRPKGPQEWKALNASY